MLSGIAMLCVEIVFSIKTPQASISECLGVTISYLFFEKEMQQFRRTKKIPKFISRWRLVWLANRRKVEIEQNYNFNFLARLFVSSLGLCLLTFSTLAVSLIS